MKTRIILLFAIFVTQLSYGQKLLWNKIYTSANQMFVASINGVQQTSTTPLLWNVSVYDTKVVAKGINGDFPFIGRFKSRLGDFYVNCYGTSEYHLAFLDNQNLYIECQSTYYGIEYVSTIYTAIGNHMYLYGGQSGSINGNTPRNNSGNKCSVCNGTGNCSSISWTANKHYCHGSGVCGYCNGQGQITKYGQTVNCTSCDTSRVGRCHYCHGTGRCSACGGTGRR